MKKYILCSLFWFVLGGLAFLAQKLHESAPLVSFIMLMLTYRLVIEHPEYFKKELTND